MRAPATVAICFAAIGPSRVPGPSLLLPGARVPQVRGVAEAEHEHSGGTAGAHRRGGRAAGPSVREGGGVWEGASPPPSQRYPSMRRMAVALPPSFRSEPQLCYTILYTESLPAYPHPRPPVACQAPWGYPREGLGVPGPRVRPGLEADLRDQHHTAAPGRVALNEEVRTIGRRGGGSVCLIDSTRHTAPRKPPIGFWFKYCKP